MIRGTTPTMDFYLPFDAGVLTEIYITFVQRDEKILEKKLDECIVVKNRITVKLTQDETLKFQAGNIVEIQIRAKTESGEAIASNIMRESAERILKEGVI